MMDYFSFVAKLCNDLHFPTNAVTVLLGAEKRLEQNENISAFFEAQMHRFSDANEHSLRSCLIDIESLAKTLGENPYTFDLLFVLHCLPSAHEKYRARGIDEHLWEAGLEDLSYKLKECMICKNVPGTFVGDWYEGMLRVGRFTLGRFQYEPYGVWNWPERVLPCGYHLKQGDKVLQLHIPSTGESLTDEARNHSYRMADSFFRYYFDDNPAVVLTHSWLIYPFHRDFLPKSSHILRFMNDWEIFEYSQDECFHDAWRVYGPFAELPTEEWPEDTSLRRAYKHWLLTGHNAGCGRGVMILDHGQNVTHCKGYFL